MKRLCTICKEEKDTLEFRKSGFTPNGTQKYKVGCKSCRGTSTEKYSIPKEKECNKCKITRPINEYQKSIIGKDDLQRYKGICKACTCKTSRRVGTIHKIECFNCGKETTNKKYCGRRCHSETRYKEKVNSWKEGKDIGYSGLTCQIKPFLRKYLLIKYNYTCTECGFYDNRDNISIIEVDHIDGRAKNCTEENLRVLCPNCHAMTPNFRSKNKNSDRVR